MGVSQAACLDLWGMKPHLESDPRSPDREALGPVFPPHVVPGESSAPPVIPCGSQLLGLLRLTHRVRDLGPVPKVRWGLPGVLGSRRELMLRKYCILS